MRDYAWIAVIAVLVCTGCATMMKAGEGTENVFVSTEPPGATVRAGPYTIESPGVLALSKKKSHVVIISKPGYQTVRIALRSHVTAGDTGKSVLQNTAALGWWTLGIGTAIGTTVDAMTGALKDLEGNHIHLTLTPGEGEVDLKYSDLLPKPATGKSATPVAESAESPSVKQEAAQQVTNP